MVEIRTTSGGRNQPMTDRPIPKITPPQTNTFEKLFIFSLTNLSLFKKLWGIFSSEFDPPPVVKALILQLLSIKTLNTSVNKTVKQKKKIK